MLIRVVRMHFRADAVDEFLRIFKAHETAIGNFPGCQRVVLLKDASDDLCYCTLSHWDTKESLENYRQSELFESVWKKVKPLFSKRTEAFSMEEAGNSCAKGC